ncbi:hypothetical protein ACFL1R_09260 [Candidatus Latescibacterota bacterium]
MKRKLVINFAISLGLFLIIGCSTTQNDQASNSVLTDRGSFQYYESRDDLTKDVGQIIDNYIDQVSRIGWQPHYQLSIEIKNTPALIKLSPDGRKVVIPFWNEFDHEQKKTFMNWTGNEEAGMVLFHALFNWFFIPHEITHFLQNAGFGDASKRYEKEAMANDFAVAFWMTQKHGPERLVQLESMLKPVIKRLPNPTPIGEEVSHYFNTHYQELGSDPDKYGYYQFYLVLNAIQRRASLDFEEMLRSSLPDK